MNTEKRIEQCLKAAPKPSAPDGLLGNLHRDITLVEMKARHSVLRKWLAPAGGSISLCRVAAAAAIAVVVLLPLSYGATKTVKRIIKTFEAKFEYPEENRAYGVRASIGSNDPDLTEEEAWEAQREFYELYKQGKAKEIKPGLWFAVLSNGKGFGYGGDPEMLGLSEAEREDSLKKQLDEIRELRKAGKFERTFIKEVERNGVTIRLYEDSFTLSNGKVITMGTGEGESVQDEDE